MPFELLPEESRKMTINCEIMNALLDIWESEIKLADAIDHLDDLESSKQAILNIREEEREHLDSMYKVIWPYDIWEELINKRFERYGCKEVIERNRELP